MTKAYFIQWANIHGFFPGPYGHLVRHTRNTNNKILYTERFRLGRSSALYEIKHTEKPFVPSKLHRKKTIFWHWTHVYRIPFRWITLDLHSNFDGLETMSFSKLLHR